MTERNAPRGIAWDKEKRLGKMPDVDLAAIYGVTPVSVRAARGRRGIPAFAGTRVLDHSGAASAQSLVRSVRLEIAQDAQAAKRARALGMHKSEYFRAVILRDLAEPAALERWLSKARHALGQGSDRVVARSRGRR
jgi:hypothetical protein